MLALLAKKLITAAILPPLLFIWPLLLAWLLRRRTPRLALTLAILDTVTILTLSLPISSNWIAAGLEPEPLQVIPAQSQAIVCLGGGKAHVSPEFSIGSPSAYTLQRLRYCALLARQSGLPVLVSGGAPDGGEAEAVIMARSLEKDFDVPVRWIEANSLDTQDNAMLSADILQPAGVKHIILVSHAWHLPRAQMAFKEAGFDVALGPTAYTDITPYPYALMPSTFSLHQSTLLLRERLGMIWYRIKH